MAWLDVDTAKIVLDVQSSLMVAFAYRRSGPATESRAEVMRMRMSMKESISIVSGGVCVGEMYYN